MLRIPTIGAMWIMLKIHQNHKINVTHMKKTCVFLKPHKPQSKTHDDEDMFANKNGSERNCKKEVVRQKCVAWMCARNSTRCNIRHTSMDVSVAWLCVVCGVDVTWMTGMDLCPNASPQVQKWILCNALQSKKTKWCTISVALQGCHPPPPDPKKFGDRKRKLMKIDQSFFTSDPCISLCITSKTSVDSISTTRLTTDNGSTKIDRPELFWPPPPN